MVRIEVKPSLAKPGINSTWVEIEQVSSQEVKEISKFLQDALKSAKAVSDAFAAAFVYATSLCPKGNPSDIWQHLIYRRVLDLGYSDQQWKRISGFALERALSIIYKPRLEPYGLKIRPLPKKEAFSIFSKLGFKGEIKADKVDGIIERKSNDIFTLFAGLHVKASLAERIQDDVPASLALMSKGILSIVLTMDSKSYPPPHGNGINYGELGGRSWTGLEADKSRIKRQYVEEDGQFDALFSYNLRTPPSPEKTPSGKRIFTLGLHDDQPDIFVQFLIQHFQQKPKVLIRTKD